MAAAAAKSLQSCPTLCDPTDGSPPGSPSLGFFRQEHCSGLPFTSPMHACMLSRFSHVRLCAIPWTAAHQAPLSTGFSRQEYWSVLRCPSPLTTACSCNLFLTVAEYFIKVSTLFRMSIILSSLWSSQVAQMAKNLHAVQEIQVQTLGGEDPLEKEMATHSSILAWRILWTEEPGGLQSMGSQSQTWLSNSHTHTYTHTHTHTHTHTGSLQLPHYHK